MLIASLRLFEVLENIQTRITASALYAVEPVFILLHLNNPIKINRI